MTEIDTGNNRFQLINMDGVMLVNVYLPSNTGGAEGNEEYEICLKELEEKLEQECGDQEIITEIRRADIPHDKVQLTRHVPSVPTYFGYNGELACCD